MRQHDAQQQRLLLAGAGLGGGASAHPVGHGKACAVRTKTATAALAVNTARMRDLPGQPVLHRKGWLGGQMGGNIAFKFQPGGGKTIGQRLFIGIEAADHVHPRGHGGYRMAGHGVLKGGKPAGIGVALGQQAAALRHGAVMGCEFTGMAGFKRLHQPVEKTPPPLPFKEQAIHLRRDPYGREIFANAIAVAQRLSVHPEHPALGSQWIGPCCELHGQGLIPVHRLHLRCNTPQGRAMAGQFIHARAPQPTTGNEQRHGFKQIGLTAAIRPGNDRNRLRRLP